MQQSELESQTQKVYKVDHPENARQLMHLGKIISQCFSADLSNWQAYVQRLGQPNFRVILQQARVVGGLSLYPMGQWYGGQSVPMTGLAAVAITPDARGQGAAVTLLRQTLRELHEQNRPLACLYASTTHLYRRVGFEHAGSSCRYSLPVNQIHIVDRTLPVTPIEISEQALFVELYRQQAQFNNGNLERNDAIWSSILDDKDKSLYAYLLGPRPAPEGYAIFTQKSARNPYNLEIQDLVLLTVAAARRFLTFMADHRSLADRMFWQDSPAAPLISVLEEQSYRVEHLERWLLRILDVPQALALRGYPMGVEAELYLKVVDNLLPANTGCFRLQVSDGKGKVTHGTRGDLTMEIGGLAPLYSGLMTARQLQQAGLISGTEASLATACTLFSGATPWMSEHF